MPIVRRFQICSHSPRVFSTMCLLAGVSSEEPENYLILNSHMLDYSEFSWITLESTPFLACQTCPILYLSHQIPPLNSNEGELLRSLVPVCLLTVFEPTSDNISYSSSEGAQHLFHTFCALWIILSHDYLLTICLPEYMMP